MPAWSAADVEYQGQRFENGGSAIKNLVVKGWKTNPSVPSTHLLKRFWSNTKIGYSSCAESENWEYAVFRVSWNGSTTIPFRSPRYIRFSKKNQVKPLKKIRWHKEVKRYQCELPGERVQIDTCKIGLGVYKYITVDDCTRYKVVAVYSRVSAKNTLQFLEKLIEEMPFPIQRIRTDRGREFFTYQVQETLMEWGIKFRLIRPRSPQRKSRTGSKNGSRRVLFNCEDQAAGSGR